MRMKFIIFIGLFAFVLANPSSQQWDWFKSNHSKVYQKAEEDRRRMAIFFENLKEISEHNDLFDKGVVTYRLNVNSYGDLTNEEFLRKMNGLNEYAIKNAEIKQEEYESHGKHTMVLATTRASSRAYSNVNLPKSVDWRTKGAVTEVKDQGSCGSCWAFSTTGALEGQQFLKTGKLVSLSEQNLVDCTDADGDDKCSGRSRHDAIDWIKDHGGIETEQSYPYKAKGGSCKYNKKLSAATVHKSNDIPRGDEKKLQEAIANSGPISVGIDYTGKSFKFYSSGIYYEPKCDPNKLTHAVLAVGYGTDEHGKDYYIVKNSWGKKWGENGYIKMARNRNNNCGIASAAIYPDV